MSTKELFKFLCFLVSGIGVKQWSSFPKPKPNGLPFWKTDLSEVNFAYPFTTLMKLQISGISFDLWSVLSQTKRIKFTSLHVCDVLSLSIPHYTYIQYIILNFRDCSFLIHCFCNRKPTYSFTFFWEHSNYHL